MSRSRVFISYAAPDRPFAVSLVHALEERGAEAFDVVDRVAPGEDIWTSITSALKKSDLFVFVVPRFEGQGKSALAEVGAAKALGKRIVAVLPDQVRTQNNDVVSILAGAQSLQVSGRDIGAIADQLLAVPEAA